MQAEKVVFKTEDEWRKERLKGIGGSDPPVVLGVSPWQSALSLWAEKRGLENNKPQTEQMAWGKRIQRAIAEGHEDETGHKVQDQGIHTYVNKQFEWMRYSADGLIPTVGNKWNLEDHVLFEAQNSGYLTRGDLEQEFPIYFEVQVQHGLFCLGLEEAVVAILLRGNQLFWKSVRREDDFIQDMLVKENEFWERVQSGDPPPPDEKESTTRTIQRLHPKDNGKTITLPMEAAEWHGEISTAKTEIKMWKERQTLAENKLKLALGDATFGVLPGIPRYSYKYQSRAGYEVAPTEFRQLRELKK